MRAERWAALVVTVAWVGASAPGAVATTYVPNRFDDPSVGGTTCTPPAPANGCSLRGALGAAQTGDTIQLGVGTYGLTRGALVTTKAVTVAGAGPGSTTILQRGLGRVLEFDNGVAATVSGLTITGGEVIGSDGPDGTSVTPAAQAGQQAEGAGIDASGSLTLTDVVVSRNLVAGGRGGRGFTPGSGGGGAGGKGGVAFGAGVSAQDSTLTRVAILDNLAIGGDGGSGGTGAPSGAGGAGGDVFAAGLLLANGTLRDVLIAGNKAISGNGGSGGGGAVPFGAAGGNSGLADSAALFSNHSVQLTNVTVTGNAVKAGNGGNGGTGVTAGNGGNSLAPSGGGIGLWNGADGHIASSTIADNSATGGVGGSSSGLLNNGAQGLSEASQGGNLSIQAAHVHLRDTIIAGGIADSSFTANCYLVGMGGGDEPIVSLGHNLEDGSDCIDKPTAGDIQNKPAGLGGLQANGGPLATMALLAGSAALHAGQSSCTDAADNPLSADARGLPRSSPCDIGAFEGQPPASATAPIVTGTPAVGASLTCNPGSFTGDEPQSLAVSWLRDGTAITGAAADHYVVAAGDRGHSLACRDTATNIYGTGSGTSASVQPPPVPAISGLTLKPRTVHAGKAESVSFRLNTATRVTFSLRRCTARKCAHSKRAKGAPPALTGMPGRNSERWTPAKLKPGTYRLTATPAGGVASPALTFAVKR